MGLFSRKKSEPAEVEVADVVETFSDKVDDQVIEEAGVTPAVTVSVQAHRGLGNTAGPEIDLTEPARTQPTPARPAPDGPSAPGGTRAPTSSNELPLAPADPPEQTQTVDGMVDNVLLREALKLLPEGPSNAQLLGVLRQALQGHFYLRVQGDARQLIADGQQLAIGVVRGVDERTFLMAFSNGAAVRDSISGPGEGESYSAVLQPVMGVLQQVLSGEFAGLILDNASAPHSAVFPREVIQKAVEQADPELALKTILAAPRAAETVPAAAAALTNRQVWIAVSKTQDGQLGVAELKTATGKRYLQLFSHPLELIALGRDDQPTAFTPAQLAGVLTSQPGLDGVLIDAAGPALIIERGELDALLALAERDGVSVTASD